MEDADQRLRVLAWPAFDNTTGNPYNRLLYEAMQAQGVEVEEFAPERMVKERYDVWHMHWPDDWLSESDPWRAVRRGLGLLMLMAWARLRGTRIVWTVHNLGPHESYYPALERVFWPLFLRQIDGFISLSMHGKAAAERAFPPLQHVPGFVVPHGHYRTAYPNEMDRAEARAALDLDPDVPVLLYVGRIRAYKNVPHLVRTFRAMERDDVRLLVAGNPVSDTLRKAIEAAAEADGRIQLALRFIPDGAMQLYLNAADLVVLPYRDILHSGSALLALSFDRPVMVPDRGAMEELQGHVGPGWVHTYDGPLTPERLEEGLAWALDTPRPDRVPLDTRDWNVLARQTVDAYRTVLDRAVLDRAVLDRAGGRGA